MSMHALEQALADFGISLETLKLLAPAGGTAPDVITSVNENGLSLTEGTLALSPATTTVIGGVNQAAVQADFAGADITALKVELNTFLTKLETAGIVATP